MDLATLSNTIDELVGSDPSLHGDAESVLALCRELSRLECFVAKATAEFDLWGEWGTSGAKTSVAYLTSRTHLPGGEARRLVRRARALCHLPEVTQAWSEGSITGHHLDQVLSVRKPCTEATLARDEEMLVGQAKKLSFSDFAAALAYWEQCADPEGAEESDLERRARRDVYLVKSLSGMYLGKMTLDPVSGTIVGGELERIEQLLFEEDWAKAKSELGRDPKVTELCRTPAQRRADALVEMALRSRSTPKGAQRPEPSFSILVGYEAIYGRICRIEGGPVISPGTALRWLDGATFERVVFAPGTRIECSIKSRFFTGATRRAIELRDQQCTNEHCEEPAERCQADHIIPFSQDGPTNQENGQLLCNFHNRQKSDQGPPGGRETTGGQEQPGGREPPDD